MSTFAEDLAALKQLWASTDTLYQEAEVGSEYETALHDALDAITTARKRRAELAVSNDEPREWVLREEGHDYDTIEAATVEEALQTAVDNVDRSNYPVDDGDTQKTIWIEVRVRCEETGESDSTTVRCDPEEPDCESGHEHEWESPYEVFGGLKENPGVRGHGGGVIVKEQCAHCGQFRTTDTWAQNPSNGQQGLTSVTYSDEQP